MPSAGDKKRLNATGIPADDFITNLKVSGPTNLLLFLDACHSGVVLLGKGGAGDGVSVSGSVDSVIARLNKGNDGVTMAFVSATADGLSWRRRQPPRHFHTLSREWSRRGC